jgi:putative DNA primase/helicase
MSNKNNTLLNEHKHTNFNNQPSFNELLTQNGYPPINLVYDGKIHRFGKDGKLWYTCYETHAVAGDWSEELQKVKWCDKTQWNTFSKEEREQKKLEIQQLQEQNEKERIELQKQATIYAQEVISKASKSGNSKYLQKKKLNQDNGVFFGKNEEIIIPIYDIEGELVSLQTIFQDGKKQFLKNGKTKGCFYEIGKIENAKEVYICEGYATGLTVYNITKKPVIVCFYAGNISPVLENLLQQYPHKTFIIAGDNDAYKELNTGKIKSEEASKKFGCKVILPKFKNVSSKPTDWSDLYILEGKSEVKKQLEGKRLKILNLAELLQYDIPQKQSLLEPILQEGNLAMIYAKRGVGKTFASLEVAFAVASGGNMFDGKWKANKPRKVLFLDGEMPAITIKERLAEIVFTSTCKNFNPENLQIITPDLQEQGMPDITTVEGQNAINEFIEENTSLVIIDNLSTLARTGRENESESWLPVQEWILSLRRRNIAVVIIHHANKSGEQRGNSKKEDILDTVIKLERPSDYKTEEGARFEVVYTKARNFQGEEAKSFEATKTANGWKVADIEGLIVRQVLDLHKEGLTQRDIAQEVGKGLATVNRIIKNNK